MDKKSKKKWFGPTKIKRLFDICASFLALVVLSPLFLVICIVNLFTPECSVFFSHERRGRRGKPFTIYKFQTMKNNTPNCATGELENPEQYITKFGKFLRKTSLDELPQLWNILKGDMSFIGPRPVVLTETELLARRRRLGADLVRPGITGLAQVRGRDTVSIQHKARYDAYYARRMSLGLDGRIVLETLRCVVTGEGIREGGHSPEAAARQVSGRRG